MEVILNWGNIDLSTRAGLQDLIERNVEKIKRLINSQSTIRLEVRFKYDPRKNIYKTTLNLYFPKNHHYITERSFSLEQSLNLSIKELRRKIRKEKEKRLSLKRRHNELTEPDLPLTL